MAWRKHCLEKALPGKSTAWTFPVVLPFLVKLLPAHIEGCGSIPDGILEPATWRLPPTATPSMGQQFIELSSQGVFLKRGGNDVVLADCFDYLQELAAPDGRHPYTDLPGFTRSQL
jgi:hypothetical protein